MGDSIKRAGKAVWKLWGIVRHLLAVRSLLQWTHWWEPVTAALAAICFGIWVFFVNIPRPIVALVALFVFVISLAGWRGWNLKMDVEHKLIPGGPVKAHDAPQLFMSFDKTSIFKFSVKNYSKDKVGVDIRLLSVDGPNYTLESDRIEVLEAEKSEPLAVYAKRKQDHSQCDFKHFMEDIVGPDAIALFALEIEYSDVAGSARFVSRADAKWDSYFENCILTPEGIGVVDRKPSHRWGFGWWRS